MVDETVLEVLTGQMGYGESDARIALQVTQNNIEHAINYLLENVTSDTVQVEQGATSSIN